jgi:chromosome segregation protein
LFVRAQADLSGLDQKIAQQRERRAVAQAEIRGWQERAGEAERRIAEMNKRSAEIAGELEAHCRQTRRIIAHDLTTLAADKAAIGEKLAALAGRRAGQRSRAEGTRSAAWPPLLKPSRRPANSAPEPRRAPKIRMPAAAKWRGFRASDSNAHRRCCRKNMALKKANSAMPRPNRRRLEKLQFDRERIGPVNLIAADELTELETEIEKGQSESEELTLAINRLRGSIGSLNREGRTRLLAAFETVDQHFQRLFTTLFNGGQAHLALIDSDDPLEAGLEIFAQPPGKKLQSLTLLSGGEQALTAVALIFALFLTNPAPICVLDEVDAPLDDANIERFCDLLDAMTRETDTRYLIVTHNAVTMSRMHRLFGVTMVEQGVSRLVSVDLGGAEQLLAAE